MADRDVLINLIVNGRNNAKGALADASKQLDNLKGSYGELNDELDKYESHNKTLERASKGQVKFFDDQRKRVKAYQDQIATSGKSIQTTLKSVDTKIKSLSGGTEGLTRAFNNLSKDADKVTKKYAGVAKALDDIETSGNSVQGTLASIRSELNSIKSGSVVSEIRKIQKAHSDLAKSLKTEDDQVKISSKNLKKWMEIRANNITTLERENALLKDNLDYNRKAGDVLSKTTDAYYKQMDAVRKSEEIKEKARKADILGMQQQLDGMDKLDKMYDKLSEKEKLRAKQEQHLAMLREQWQADADAARAARQARYDRQEAARTRLLETTRQKRAEADVLGEGNMYSIRDSGPANYNASRSALHAKERQLDAERKIAEAVSKRIELKKKEIELDKDHEYALRVKERMERPSLFKRGINKISGGRVDLEDKNDQFRNLRGLTSELRGFGIAFIIKNIQGITSAATGAAGGLVSLAGSAVGAGAALGGALAAGAAQAVGPLAILASTIGRITAITKVLNLKQQIAEASTHTGQADAIGGASDAVAAAQDRVADSLRGVTQAQKDYNDAVREAKRNLQDMRLEQARANLNLEDAQRNLAAASLGGDTAAIASARLDLREAQLKARRAGQDNRLAQKGGVKGDPGVIKAQERIADANRQSAQATRALADAQEGLAAAGDGATASQDRLSYMLEQLTGNERKLVKSVENLQGVYKKTFRGVSDIIVRELANSTDKVAEVFGNKELMGAFARNASAGASAMRRITDFMVSPESQDFIKRFMDLSTKNIPLLTDGLLNIGKAFMNIADNSSGIFNVILGDAVKLSENIAKATASSEDFFKKSLGDYAVWRDFLKEIWGLFKVIFEPARTAGTKMISIWADAIGKFVDKLEKNPEALSKFFMDGVYVTNQILRVIWEIGKALHEVFNPASVKSLADFLVMIVIPAFEQVIKTIGLLTHAVQVVLTFGFVPKLVQWILTVTLLTRAFEIMTTAIKNIGLALASTVAPLGGGKGWVGTLRMMGSIAIIVASALGVLGVSLKDLADMSDTLKIALIGLGGALVGLKIGGAIKSMMAYTAALKAAGKAATGLALVEGILLAGMGKNPSKGKIGNYKQAAGFAAPAILSTPRNAIPAAKAGLTKGIGKGLASIGLGSLAARAGGGIAAAAAAGGASGSVVPVVGTILGAITAAGAAYLILNKRQKSAASGSIKAARAIDEQRRSIERLTAASDKYRGAVIDSRQAAIDLRSARSNRKQVLTDLTKSKAQGGRGLTEAQAKKTDEYRQAMLDVMRADDALKDALKNRRKESRAYRKGLKEEAEKNKKGMVDFLDSLNTAKQNVNKEEEETAAARRRLDNAKGPRAEYRARKALAKQIDEEREAKKKLQDIEAKLPEIQRQNRIANKKLGGSYKDVTREFDKMVTSIQKGVNTTLTKFGVKPIQISASGTGYKNASEKDATGGFVGRANGGWIGKAGEKGRDTVKTILGRGEAVLNHTQQRIVNGALANSGISGLDEVFQRTKGSYHYMAGGGFAGMAPGITSAAKTVLGKFPGLMLFSGRRNRGGTSYHETGRAADLAGPVELMHKAAQWIKTSSLAKRLAEGIHNPNLSIKNGKTVSPGFWGGQTWAGHADHIHIAVAGAIGKIVGGISGDFKKLKVPKIKGNNKNINTVFKNSGKRMIDAANKFLEKKAASVMSDQDSGAPSGAGKPAPPGKVRSWLTEALRITGHYTRANLNALYGRTMQESGGNPKAINLWDSNAKAGTPSKGLLQTIDPTFNAHKMKGYGNIWNPVHNAIAAIRYMFSRYGHIVGRSSTGYASGGFAGMFHGGGTIPGSGDKTILARGGETVLTSLQLNKTISSFSTIANGLSSFLKSFKMTTPTLNRVRPDYGSSDVMLRKGIKEIESGVDSKKTSKGLDKALKAIRNITADNGVIAQFATVLEKFANGLSNAIKVASYRFNGAGKAIKTMTDLEIAAANVTSINKQGALLGEQISKLRVARKSAASARNKAAKARNDIDDDLGALYDRVASREAAGLSTESVKRSIKRREAKMRKTAKGRRKLSRFKRSNNRLGKLRKGVSSIDSAIGDMEANQADLAQQAYEAQYDYIQQQNSNSTEQLDIANTNSDIAMAGSVSASANASMKNAALAQRNTEIDSVVAQLQALGGKDSEIAKLRQEQELNRQEMDRNTTATIVNTSQLKQGLAAFKGGVINTGVGIFRALGALTGTTNNAGIANLLGMNATNLAGNRTGITESLNQILAKKGMAGIGNLSGEALVTSLVGLMGTDTTSWTPEDQDAFRDLINSLLENEAAVIENTQQLKDLNGNGDQGFSSYSWTAFRQAVFDGTGGLMPNYQNLVPQLDSGGEITKDGLAYVHAAEVVLNREETREWKNGKGEGDFHLHIDTPLEVADPIALSNKFMYELKHRGK